jgi:hypothetical protein
MTRLAVITAAAIAFGACGAVPEERPAPEKVEQVQQAQCGFWPFGACQYSDPDATLLGCGPVGWPPAAGRARFTKEPNDEGQCFEIDCNAQRNSIARLGDYGFDNQIRFTWNGPGVISQHYQHTFWSGTMYPVWPDGVVNDWGSSAGISSLICWGGQ